MKFSRHIAEGIPFNRARWIGGQIVPTVVVLHDTASRTEHGSAARYLQNTPASAKTSVHFVIERNGEIEQQVPTNRRANHAGASHFHGRDGVNDFSVGIELVNPGQMSGAPDAAQAVTWFKQAFATDAADVTYVSTPEHGAGWWMDYTPEQIEGLTALLIGLFDYIPSLTDITTHWYISPGRKIDTNPLFPLDHIRAIVLGRDDVAGRIADDQAAMPVEDDEMVAIDVPGARLNMRRWPSFNPNIIARIPDGVHVPVVLEGQFAGRDWLKVRFDGLEGWIVASHTAPVIH